MEQSLLLFKQVQCHTFIADRVYQINLAIAGIAVGTVSLPVLSKAFKMKNVKKISNIQNKSFELSLLFLFLQVWFNFSFKQIVNALFGYGSFSKMIDIGDALSSLDTEYSICIS